MTGKFKKYKTIKLILIIFLFCVVSRNIFNGNIAYAEEELSGSIDVMMSVDDKTMQPYIESFMQKYPEVTVNYTYLPDYENDIRQRLKDGNYGDVLYMPGFVDMAQYESYFMPLGTVESLSEQYNYIENTCRIGDVVYAIPTSAYLEGIIYNKDVFYKAGIVDTPKSIEEFLMDMQLIKERTDAIPFCSNYNTEWALFYWSAFPFLEMTGDPDYRNNKMIYEADPYLEGSTHYSVYKLLYDIVQMGLCEDDIHKYDWNTSCQMLADGDFGCMVVGSWAIGGIRDKTDNDQSIGFMPFPNEVDGMQYVTVYNDYSYALSSNSKNKEVARAFIDFMLNESGYAMDQDRVSIVKTDTFPESYGRMKDTIDSINNSFNDETYYYGSQMLAAINPDTTSQIKRIIEAAKGYSKENFDDIALDWNNRWEGARPKYMPVFVRNTIESTAKEENRIQVHNEAENIFQEKSGIVLSEVEKEYIENKKLVKIGYLMNMAPFQYVSDLGKDNKIGNFEGLSANLCQIIEDETGLEAEYIPYKNTNEIQIALEDGEIDIAAGMEYSSALLNRFKFSKEYIDYVDVIIKTKDTDAEKLDDTIQAIILGEPIKNEIITTNHFLELNTIKDVFNAVNKKNANYGIVNYYSAEYYTKYDNYKNIIVIPTAQRHGLRLAFYRKTDTRLITICNKCLYNLTNENIQLMLTQVMDPPAKRVTLTRYIDSNPIQSTVIIVLSFTFLVISFLFFRNEKYKNAQKHAVEAKKFEILSQLTDEYVFVYYYQASKIHFDKKFKEKFGIDENINLLKYSKNNIIINTLIQKAQTEYSGDHLRTSPFELSDSKGIVQWYVLTAYKIEDNMELGGHFICKLINVQKDMEQQLLIREQADRDGLTKLYNRSGFENKFNFLLEHWSDTQNMAIAVLDFDNFKMVNDTLGHDGGDEALKTLAETIKKIMPSNSISGRYGGDEFMICLYDLKIKSADDYFKKLVVEMNKDMVYQSKTYHLSISLGAVYTTQKVSYDVIFNEADQVLYKAKKEGKNRAITEVHLEL